MIGVYALTWRHRVGCCTGPLADTCRRRWFSTYKAVEKGEEVHGFVLKDKNFRLFIEENGRVISPWHEIPLYVDESKGIVNFVNEIPLGTVEKMEIATKEEHNPILQDTKKGQLRNYPFRSLVNYGCLPMTYENPNEKDSRTGLLGDGDPIDVVEVSQQVASMGEVYPVKLLGILGMIDEGEMDWKAIAINIEDPLAASINTIQELEKHMPGKIDAIVSWFKYYKVPDGKPVNEFAFEDKPLDLHQTMEIIKETHQQWQGLNGENPK